MIFRRITKSRNLACAVGHLLELTAGVGPCDGVAFGVQHAQNVSVGIELNLFPGFGF